MKKINLELVLSSSVALLLNSCSNSGAPSCSDSDVTNTAVELYTKGLPLQVLSERAASSDCLNRAFMSLATQDLDTLKTDDPCVNAELDKARAYVAEVRSKGITNIRTTGRDKELRKTMCTGDLGEYHDIQYSAQYTDDGQVYVEIY